MTVVAADCKVVTFSLMWFTLIKFILELAEAAGEIAGLRFTRYCVFMRPLFHRKSDDVFVDMNYRAIGKDRLPQCG